MRVSARGRLSHRSVALILKGVSASCIRNCSTSCHARSPLTASVASAAPESPSGASTRRPYAAGWHTPRGGWPAGSTPSRRARQPPEAVARPFPPGAGHMLDPQGRPADAQLLSSFASRLISGTAPSALEIGQFSFAIWAACWNPASSTPATRPTVARSILVTVKPSPSLRICTFASGLIDSGALPPSERTPARNIEKQLACAAATSSSGLVPPLSPKRDSNEYLPSSEPDAALKLPSPLRRSPSPWPVAVLIAICRSSSSPRDRGSGSCHVG